MFFSFLYWTLELFRQCGINVFFIFLLDFGTVRQCAIICFYMGLWNCSDSVSLFGFLLNFGTVPTVWHYWFFIFLLDFETVPTVWHYYFVYGTLMLFRQCGIICLSMGFWTFPKDWHYWFFIFILDFGTDSVSIIWFSMGLWNYFHSVALSIYLLDIGTDQTFWYDWFFYGTLELYWQWAIICFSIVLLNSSDSVSIICFSMVFWNYSHSVALSVYLLDFVPIL
jgi:hypothetical protein